MAWPEKRTGSRAATCSALLGCLLVVGPGARGQVTDPIPGPIPLGDLGVEVELVAQLPDSGSGSRPRARPMTLVGDGQGRRFVVDQNGLLYQLHPDDSLSVFLDVGAALPSLVTHQRQMGVNSVAFHPDFAEAERPGRGKVYTSSSHTSASGTPDYPVPSGAPTSHHSVIHEWDVDPTSPDEIDPASAREILRIAQPYGDHNVGQIGFDPNAAPGSADHGLLFIAVGDGGNYGCCPRPFNDPHLAGQDLSHPLGSLLRIDPLASGPAPYSIPASNPFAADGDPDTLAEVYSYGLRNPHRFSFDTGGQGKLLVSDIGQANVEEINLVEPGDDHGWSEREGTFLLEHDNELEVFPLPPDDATLGYVYPVIQYDHDEGDDAISGGYVYRGRPLSPLTGHYVFGDLVSGRVFSAPQATLDGSGPAPFSEIQLIDASDGMPRSLLEMIGGGSPAPRADLRFGMDDEGTIYLVTKQDGSVRRLVPGPIAVPALGPAARLVLVLALLFAGMVARSAGRAWA